MLKGIVIAAAAGAIAAGIVIVWTASAVGYAVRVMNGHAP